MGVCYGLGGGGAVLGWVGLVYGRADVKSADTDRRYYNHTWVDPAVPAVVPWRERAAVTEYHAADGKVVLH